MPDHLTLLENKLDERYTTLMERISDPAFVTGWDDWNFRAGYLKAIRDIGQMAKDVRAPENVPSEGIPDVFALEGVDHG